MNKVIFGGAVLVSGLLFCCPKVEAAGFTEVGEFGRPFVIATEDTEEQIQEEIRLGEMELLAQLVEAEAGNQCFEGKCLVVDTVLNRVESDEFPDTITEVIFQSGAFSVTWNGAFEKAAWNMQESDYAAVACEMELHSNKKVIAFNCNKNVAGNGKLFKCGGHWFREG